MNINEIKKLLKRDYPLLLIDGVTYIEKNKVCDAYKNLTYNEWFFPVHFSNNPILPGALQIEAFTQVVALPLLIESNNKIPMLSAIDKVRFYKPILPGDRFEIHCDIDKIINKIAFASVTGRVNNETVSECKIIYKIMETMQ